MNGISSKNYRPIFIWQCRINIRRFTLTKKQSKQYLQSCNWPFHYFCP
jgi:hypothetical protein